MDRVVGIVIVGAQWGDEGKGLITDYYASKADLVVRFQGGNNAGYTVIVGDKVFKFHLFKLISQARHIKLIQPHIQLQLIRLVYLPVNMR